MLEISINHTSTNVWVPSSLFLPEFLYNFIRWAYVFLLCPEGKVRFTKKKALYFNRNAKLQMSQGLGLQCSLPQTRYLYWGLPLGGEETLYGQRSPPISLSLTAVPSRLVAPPGRGWNNAALVTGPSYMVGRLTVLPKWPPSLSSLFRNVSNPIYHVPSSVYNLKK